MFFIVENDTKVKMLGKKFTKKGNRMKTFKSFMSEGSKEEYQKFFDGKLAKWKIKSPTELSDEDKKKFFAEIEKEWTGEKDEEVVKEFIKKDGARRRCAGGDGRKNKKVKSEEGADCPEDEDEEDKY